MPSVKNKPVVKSAVIDNTISSAISNLVAACDKCAQAVDVRTSEAKRNTLASKRLTKKRAVLSKRKMTAAAKLKKAPSAETRKVLSVTEKELASVKKEIDKLQPAKEANATELATLRANLRRLSAYIKAFEQTDKVLSKPKKKARKKRPAAAAPAVSE